MKLKKILCLLLVACFAVAMLAACGNEEPVASSGSGATASSSNSEAGGGFDEDPAEINVIWWHMNVIPSDMELVSETLSEYTLEKINVKVNLNIMDAGTYIQQAPLMVSSNEKVDLMCTFPAAAPHFSSMTAQGQLMPLNDLLDEYGTGIAETLPNAAFLEATTIDGQIYGVPPAANKVTDLYWYCRADELAALGFDVADLATVDDIEEVLYAVKEQMPNMTPLDGNAKTSNLMYVGMDPIDQIYFDVLGEQTAFVAAVPYTADGTTDYEVVNYYATDEFRGAVERLRTWYNDGLINKDLATKDEATDPLTDPNSFSAIVAGNSSRVGQLQAGLGGTELASVKLQGGAVATGQLIQMTWAVPVSATEPEAAMKFMNLMYTDEYVLNMMDYGIEGTHYVKNADGTISFMDGQDQSNSGFYTGSTAFVGNTFLAYPLEGNDPNTNEIMRTEMENAVYSPLVGFSFNLSDMQDIFTVISPLTESEYRPGLVCGSAPDGTLDELLEKLDAAGVDEYLAEAQAQLDAWLASK